MAFRVNYKVLFGKIMLQIFEYMAEKFHFAYYSKVNQC